MRNALIRALCEQADGDDRVFLVTGDLGWSVVEPFAERHADRFLNAGVAEQNMVGLATGLAQAGFVPFVYSIATFASMRAYEQIRNGPVVHGLPVRIVGIGGGFAYGPGGATHFALEDLCIMRCQPALTVIAPADPAQTLSVLRAIRDVRGPVYLRIGKGGNREVPNLDGRFALGRPEVVRAGADVLILATGAIATAALEAAAMLAPWGLSVAVAVLAHVPYTTTAALTELLAGFRAIVTVEEGFVAGGLGSLVAETIAQRGLAARLRICGVTVPLDGISGSETSMRQRAGLSVESLAQAVAELSGAR
ncbi:MAG TPA: transketolase C-terminal domain-containing protein [Candidatus Methylomirabilis sp.]|nr:transketolase C-terminal domain-containing protein [Candidatus Methylomirabilis sp.]